MTVALVKTKPQPVVTVTSGSPCPSQSLCLPLQFILKLLCQITGCCSCDDRMQQKVGAALGTIQILLGFVSIGVGTGRTSTRDGELTATYWLGAAFAVCGIATLLWGRCCPRYTAGLTLSVNVMGTIVSIVGIVLSAINLGDASVVWMCSRTQNATDVLDDNCTPAAFTVQSLVTGMDLTMIVLCVLHLCVCVVLAVFATKALTSKKKKEGRPDADIYQGVLKEYPYDQNV